MADSLSFLWTFVASVLLAGSLAAAGAHLATRQLSLNSLCLAQGAEVGALASVFFAYLTHDALDRGETWVGLGGSLIGALIAGGFASRLSAGQSSSRTPRLFTFWIVLIAATHLAVAMHPALESHLARVFLGDLGTLTDPESQTISVLSACALLILIFAHSSIAQATFDTVALGKATRHSSGSNGFMHLLCATLPFLVLPAVSTWGAGFLFTCAALFLPTTLLSSDSDSSKQHIALCVTVSAISAPIGLFIALTGEKISTVPAMIVSILCGCLVVKMYREVKTRLRTKILQPRRSE